MHEDRASDLVVGREFSATVVEDLTRAHIAQYAGASGDFNLIHVDERFATVEAGRDGVIAHGMLTMGLTGGFVTSLIRPGTLSSFGGRFLTAVSPGDALLCVAVVSARDDTVAGGPAITLAVETRRPDGAVVFAGTAVARLPAAVDASSRD